VRADARACSVLGKDARKFWRDIDKISNARATAATNTVGGVSGDTEILATVCARNTMKDYIEKSSISIKKMHLLTSAMH
jgi:hypothetical protein